LPAAAAIGVQLATPVGPVVLFVQVTVRPPVGPEGVHDATGVGPVLTVEPDELQVVAV
jgi:hypothetical protein